MASAPAYDDVPLGDMNPGHAGLPKYYTQEGKLEDRFGFYKPRTSYKRVSLVLGGLVVALTAVVIGLGVTLDKAKAPHHELPVGSGAAPVAGPTPAPGINATSDPLTSFAAWNSTACTQPSGNCTALLSETQVNNCFVLVWNICNTKYNETHPIPRRTDTMFMNNPQCNHLIFQMYCQFESAGAGHVCDAMVPFCAEEYLSPPPPPITTSDWVRTTFTVTETLLSFSGGPSGAITGIPISTSTVTLTELRPPTSRSGKTALMAPAPSQTSSV
ncbi:hypothetical protein NA56DRAFT_650589 [Hyaloscypha hepaticicola]|uniref:Uncharacterized protein n=1 Tax=Hyaloscypha hepaticicola TaxID=2082293 RepID=A0A2J6PL97_9HELO|nr:hypothetical protein NA56DRAFT_650589 [Hyaloscypha hepaticicola]